MIRKKAIKIIAAYSIITISTTLFAHDLQDGEGMLGAHWHSSDVMGYVILAIVAAITLWHCRGDK